MKTAFREDTIGQGAIPLPLEPEGLRYPGLWIGTWSMGGEGFGPHDLSESLSTLKAAFDAGIRHFDTAGFYAQGRSEELLRKAFSAVREKVFLSSKGGLKRQGRRVWHDARPESLRQALHDTLKRLDTDYLDLFQLHWPDPAVPIDESVDALRQMRSEGLIRFWGAGNLSAEQVLKYIGPGERIPHQVHFNPIHQEGLAIMQAGREGSRCINCVISPFEQGLLVNPHYLTARLGKKDVRRRNPYFGDEELKKRLESLFDLLKRRSVLPERAILAWLMGMEEVDVVIPGPRRCEQLKRLIDGLWGWNRMEKEILEMLDSLGQA
jgi:aryl-alcohol dehydrogenase-like predicted oxidoreductase